MNWKFIRFVDTYLGIPLIYLLLLSRRVFRLGSASGRSPATGRVLIVKFWGIGNIFMLLPTVAAIRHARSSARLDLLTLTSNREAAETTEAFDAVYAIDTSSVRRFAGTVLATCWALRRNAYDVVIDFEQFARFSALFCAFAGGRTTIGFATKGQHRHFLYTLAVPYDNTIHITRSFSSLAAGACTGGTEGRRIRSTGGTAGGEDFRRELGIGPDEVVFVMHLGTSGNFQERRWPARCFTELADRLFDRFDVRIVFTGLRDDVPLVGAAKASMLHRDRLVDLTGMLSFRQFSSLISASDLVISADTASVHVASCAGIPVVGLYGPNTPVLYGPWGPHSHAIYKKLPCSPCITNFNAKIHTCRHSAGRGACMQQIGVEEVYSSIVRLCCSPRAPGRLTKLRSRTLCAASSH